MAPCVLSRKCLQYNIHERGLRRRVTLEGELLARSRFWNAARHDGAEEREGPHEVRAGLLIYRLRDARTTGSRRPAVDDYFDTAANRVISAESDFTRA